MKEKAMFIDYREHLDDDKTKFIRKVVDNYEFCVRDGIAYFSSCGQFYQVPLEDVSQVYTA